MIKATKNDESNVNNPIPEPVVAPEAVPVPSVPVQNFQNVTPMVSPLKKYAGPLPEGFVTAGKSKSAVIRELKHVYNWPTGDIARTLGISYQHARNVLNQTYKGLREVKPITQIAPQTTSEVSKPSIESEEGNDSAA